MNLDHLDLLDYQPYGVATKMDESLTSEISRDGPDLEVQTIKSPRFAHE